MSEQGLRRPRQVTVAGGIGLVGCLILLIGLFDSMAHTRTVDARDAVADFLSSPPGDGLGLSVAEAIDLWRVSLYVAAALAAAAFVLGIYLFQRHNGARIGFTVITALLLLAMPLVGVMPLILALATFRLWTEPARDWFAGRTPRPREVAVAEPPRQAPPTTYQPPVVAPPTASGPPPAQQPYGAPAQPYAWTPPQYLSYPPPPAQVSAKRPASVVWACVLTWVFAGLTAVGMGLISLLVAADNTYFREELQREVNGDNAQLRELGLSVDQLMVFVAVTCGLVAIWAVGAAVTAVFAWRRKAWARIVLAVSAGGAAMFSLVAILGILPVVTLIPAAATVILLLSRSANAWYRGSSVTAPRAPTPPRRNQPW